MAQAPCKECGSKCCKYVATGIDTPTSAHDFEQIRWYLLHENVHVFIDCDDVWHLEFVTRCKSLDKSGRCTAYESRPEICRVYGSESDTDECEFFDVPYKVCFRSVADFEVWQKSCARKKRKTRSTRKRR